MPKVLITGIGLWTPLGEDAPTTWSALTGGACLTVGETFEQSAQKRDAGSFSIACQMALTTTREALLDAGLWDGEKIQAVALDRVGCTISASKPFLNGATVLPPESLQETLRDHFLIQGECRNIIAACATGAYALATAALWIESGLCDVVLAGSAEPWPHRLIETGFRNMGVLSDEEVMRPFDRHRSGFVFGAGAGICVLESEAHARGRGREGIAHLSGWGLGSDSHSSVAFNSNGRHIADVIDRALKRAHLEASDISYVHAHGTATRLNDWIETQALMKAFGSQAPRLMISATKASTGHLLGAAGSVGFVLSLLALKNQFIPPTATLQEADPECPLDYTPGHGRPAPFHHALALSFGFGGPIGALLASRN
jgi:3-oxoacyl-[acyl-carrier-protein] synthase II